MSKLKLGILEDEDILLKELKRNLEKTGLAEVVVWAESANEFIKKTEGVPLDAIVLDIDLGRGMNGIQVAQRMKLPVIFASSYNGDKILEIDRIGVDLGVRVKTITKGLPDEAFTRAAKAFLEDVKTDKEKKFVILNFGDNKGVRIYLDNVVFLVADKEFGAATNNRQIFFNNREPEILVDFSFTKMEEKGFSRKIFIENHRAYRVNVDRIKRVTDDQKIIVDAMQKSGEIEEVELPISENYKKVVLTELKNRLSLP